MAINNNDGLNLAPYIGPHRLEPQTAATFFDQFSGELGTGTPVTAFQLRKVCRARSALFGIPIKLLGGEPVEEFLQFGEIHSGGP